MGARLGAAASARALALLMGLATVLGVGPGFGDAWADGRLHRVLPPVLGLESAWVGHVRDVAVTANWLWFATAGDVDLRPWNEDRVAPSKSMVLGGAPLRLAVVPGTVWVLLSQGRGLVAVDEVTADVRQRLPGPMCPVGLAADEQAVWVLHWPTCASTQAAVTRRDLATGVETQWAPWPAIAWDLAVAHGAVWVLLDGGRILRLDPQTGAQLGEARVVGRPDRLLAGNEGVYAFGDGEALSLVSARGVLVASVRVEDKVITAAETAESLWTIDGAHLLSQRDPWTLHILKQWNLDLSISPVSRILATQHTLWLSEGNTVLRFGAETIRPPRFPLKRSYEDHSGLRVLSWLRRAVPGGLAARLSAQAWHDLILAWHTQVSAPTDVNAAGVVGDPGDGPAGASMAAQRPAEVGLQVIGDSPTVVQVPEPIYAAFDLQPWFYRTPDGSDRDEAEGDGHEAAVEREDADGEGQTTAEGLAAQPKNSTRAEKASDNKDRFLKLNRRGVVLPSELKGYRGNDFSCRPVEKMSLRHLFHLGHDEGLLADDGRWLWFAAGRGRPILRYDLETGERLYLHAKDRAWTAMAANGGTLWLLDGAQRALWRRIQVDGDFERVATFEGEPTQLAISGESQWVLVRNSVDPQLSTQAASALRDDVDLSTKDGSYGAYSLHQLNFEGKTIAVTQLALDQPMTLVAVDGVPWLVGSGNIVRIIGSPPRWRRGRSSLPTSSSQLRPGPHGTYLFGGEEEGVHRLDRQGRARATRWTWFMVDDVWADPEGVWSFEWGHVLTRRDPKSLKPLASHRLKESLYTLRRLLRWKGQWFVVGSFESYVSVDLFALTDFKPDQTWCLKDSVEHVEVQNDGCAF